MNRIIMNRFKIAQCMALAGMSMLALGCLMSYCLGGSHGTIIGHIGIFVGIASYLIAGLWTAVKMALGIAKWGWIGVAFPYNFFVFIFTLGMSLMILLFVPIIPIRKAYKESMLF